MLTKDEADRIATAITAARPEWSHAQIMGVLAKQDIRERRTYSDTFHAMLAVALDANSRQPTRVLESGPWWGLAAALAEPINTTSLLQSIDWNTDCAICLKPRDHPWHGGLGTENDCDYLSPTDHHATTTNQEKP